MVALIINGRTKKVNPVVMISRRTNKSFIFHDLFLGKVGGFTLSTVVFHP